MTSNPKNVTEGFGGVGPFPKRTQPENPKQWVDVWPFVEERHETQKKKSLFLK